MEFVVIDRGILPAERKWAGFCKACKSRFECLQSDLKNITPASQRDGEFAWEVCPLCNAGDKSGYGGLLMYPVK